MFSIAGSINLRRQKRRKIQPMVYFDQRVSYSLVHLFRVVGAGAGAGEPKKKHRREKNVLTGGFLLNHSLGCDVRSCADDGGNAEGWPEQRN